MLPLNVEKIGDYAFANCSGFSGLTLNENLLSIGERAFDVCSGFEGNLVIPDKVQVIGGYAFANCKKFNGNLIIGSAMETMGHWVFVNDGGKNLGFNKVYCKVVEPLQFLGFNGGFRYLGIPVGSKEKYLKVPYYWNVEIIEEVEF